LLHLFTCRFLLGDIGGLLDFFLEYLHGRLKFLIKLLLFPNTEVNQYPLQVGFGVRQVIHQVTSECVTLCQLELDLLGLRYPGLVVELCI
jgi:hypothetical protein